jgi:protein-L-isoaspartate(D-aspartate) O-methyltransferase
MNVYASIGLVLALIWGIFPWDKPQRMDYEKLRIKMVVDQIIGRKVTEERVIHAMEKVERHLFVPGFLQGHAYNDRPLPIGHGQTISQPYIVALMTQLLDVQRHEKILEVGTGSGYQAAILGELCKDVYTIEIVKPLARTADRILDSLDYTNIHVKHGDGYQGWEEYAPFDGIIVTCSPTKIPQPLIDQLAEGGKMVIPVGLKNIKKLVLLEKKKGKIIKRNVIPVRFVPMVDKHGNNY